MGLPILGQHIDEVLLGSPIVDYHVITDQFIIEYSQMSLGGTQPEIVVPWFQLFLYLGDEHRPEPFGPTDQAHDHSAKKNETACQKEKTGRLLRIFQNGTIIGMHHDKPGSVKDQSWLFHILVPTAGLVEHKTGKVADVGNQQSNIDQGKAAQHDISDEKAHTTNIDSHTLIPLKSGYKGIFLDGIPKKPFCGEGKERSRGVERRLFFQANRGGRATDSGETTFADRRSVSDWEDWSERSGRLPQGLEVNNFIPF